jgi:hypothetical protein
MEVLKNSILLLFNTLLYLVSLILIYKRRNHSVISVRSPTLLLINNLAGFLLTSTFILYELMEGIYDVNSLSFVSFCKSVPNNYLIFHMLFMFTFVLRCHRILECSKLNYDERTEIKQFYQSRHLFGEKFYLKLLVGGIILITILNFTFNIKYQEFLIIPYHFHSCMKNVEQEEFYVSLLWIVINFLEAVVLLTYCFFVSINHIRQLIKIELYAFTIVWIMYPNFLRIGDIFFNLDQIIESHWTSYVCLFFMYLCLFINGYLPLIISFIYKKSINYHFHPKLANNLYLFLSDQTCLISFKEYLKNTSRKGIYYLNLYSDILKFKLKYTMEPDYTLVLQEARNIYARYFSQVETLSRSRQGSSTLTILNCDQIDSEVLNKVKLNCQILDKDDCSYEMFEEGLIFSYEFLDEKFQYYKQSEEFQILSDNLNLSSYIHCKMSNTGLINTY